MLIYNAMKETLMLNLLFFFSFCLFLIKADWINLNSYVSGTLTGTGDVNSYNVILGVSGKYTFTAMGSGGLNPSLSLLNLSTVAGLISAGNFFSFWWDDFACQLDPQIQ